MLKKILSYSLALTTAITGVFGMGTTSFSAELSSENSEITEQIEIAEVLPYQNTSLSFEERAADLVSRMTLEEKVAQLGHGAPEISRLGVKKYNWWKEGLHGVAREGKATSFPTALSLSNTWDPELVNRVADVTSTEARILNNTGTSGRNFGLSYWSPTINMARDPRWGRNDESYGEDPFLTTEIGAEFVKGLQGNDDKYLKTIATVKHYLANNCESERQGGTSVMDEQSLMDYYSRAFKNIMEKANPGSVMSSYNAITVTRNGENLYEYIPQPANEHTLTTLLRRHWGFEGYVVGDCGAVNNLNGKATYKRTLFPDVKDLTTVPQSATIALAIKAGNDLDCGSVSQANAYAAVKDGYMSEDEIDLALYRMFLQRMRTGEFDSGATYQDLKNTADVESNAHIAIAEEAAEKSWVLLKNENNMLPLDVTSKENYNIAIVGNLAGETYLGDYSGSPEKTTSPYEGIKALVSEKNAKATVNYLGNITDDTVIFNLKTLNLILSDGTKRKVDLSKATVESGMNLSGTSLNNVTRTAKAVVSGVDFSKVVSVEAEVSAGAESPGGKIVIGYNNANQQVASVDISSTGTEETYQTFTGEYTGASGGYNQQANLYITASVNDAFDMDRYKNELEAADVIIAYAGTTTSDSSESNDRKSIALPNSQWHTAKLAEAYPQKTVVVMQTVGQTDVSEFKDVNAILWDCYNGQTQGEALAKILTGDVNPSGRLTTTWYDPKDLEIMTVNGEGKYDDEGIKWYKNDYGIRQKNGFPGRTYQYYNGTPVYPFGYGLSYTNFRYDNLTVSKSSIDANETFDVSVDVKNIGEKDGDEIVQLYVKSPNGDGVNLPLKQLKGFKRVQLKAGESKNVTISVNAKDFYFYDEKTTSAYIPNGSWEIMVGNNAKTSELLKENINITGSLDKYIKTVSAVPSGISVIGTIDKDGNAAGAIKTINPNVSAFMSDETQCSLENENAEVSYSSSDNDIVYVDEKGIIVPSTKAGTAKITVTVTVDGISEECIIPVVSIIKAAITDEERVAYKKNLDDCYNELDKTKYSEKNWEIITNTYNENLENIEKELDKDKLEESIETAIQSIKAIKTLPPAGVDIYEITKLENGIYNDVTATIKYNGDESVPRACLIASIKDENGKLLRTSETELGDSGEYVLNDTFNDGEKLDILIWESFDSMYPLSKKHEHTYEAQKLPSFVLYNFSDSEFDSWYQTPRGIALTAVRGLNGFGEFNEKGSKKSYTYNGTTYNFTKGLQTGLGKTTERCLYFTPFPGFETCKVTILFNASEDRFVYASQGDVELGKLYGNGSGVSELTVYAQNMTDPIYIMGGGSNKIIYAVIVEYE